MLNFAFVAMLIKSEVKTESILEEFLPYFAVPYLFLPYIFFKQF